MCIRDRGYLLTGRHGFFNSYEAFIRIVDSMVSQHAKWLKLCRDIPWREDIASLNIILTSTVWAQDHNGFTLSLIHISCTHPADQSRPWIPSDSLR